MPKLVVAGKGKGVGYGCNCHVACFFLLTYVNVYVICNIANVILSYVLVLRLTNEFYVIIFCIFFHNNIIVFKEIHIGHFIVTYTIIYWCYRPTATGAITSGFS